MSRPAIDARRRHVLECLSSEIHNVGDLKAFARQEIGGSCEQLVTLALLDTHDQPPAGDTLLTASACRRMLVWLQAHTKVLDEVDAAATAYQKDPHQSAELAITLQALIQRLGQ